MTSATRSRGVRLILLAAIVFGAWSRCWTLGATGFAEDEIDILKAARAYRQLDFWPNAEHPMLAKLATFASLETATAWNAAHYPAISTEAAVRFPSAFTGGVLTTVVLFLLTAELFPDRRIAAWTSLLWALDAGATAINRTAKEDTFFLFFFLAAAWLYRRAKRAGRDRAPTVRRWYSASAASFGLMLACKYMPHYYGLHALFARITDPAPGENRPRKFEWHAIMGGVFLLANFAILLPATWARLSQYLHGSTTSHTGYVFEHTLYVNSVFVTPGGPPVSFYVAFLALKVPLVILAAFLIGVVAMCRQPRHTGFVFARIFLVFFLLPYSLLGGKFLRYMLPLLAIVDMLAAVGIVWLLDRARRRAAPVHHRWLVPALSAVCVCVPLYVQVSAWPVCGLAQNAIGAALTPPGFMFPDDEFNDADVREAVRAIAGVAHSGAVVASDASAVVEEYLQEAGRADLKSISLARQGLPTHPGETWVLAQDGHVYFENRDLLDEIHRSHTPWREWRIDGAVAVQVYALPPTPPPQRAVVVP